MGVFIHRQCACIHKEVYDNGDRMGTVCRAVLDSTQQEHFCFRSKCISHIGFESHKPQRLLLGFQEH